MAIIIRPRLAYVLPLCLLINHIVAAFAYPDASPTYDPLKLEIASSEPSRPHRLLLHLRYYSKLPPTPPSPSLAPPIYFKPLSPSSSSPYVYKSPPPSSPLSPPRPPPCV
ncbi:hypothetical protein V6N13_095501 [Hibiscus sabdariffa]|uniref:Uncharacterized protein n=1 Tax=Hibiscus sabdariffa TaxID=183260 RepID=A0ABR2PRG4_9ROSI